MQKLHKEILTKEQLELIPLIGLFKRDFGLAGGTAIALHIGHRQSIDFDLFSLKKFYNAKIIKKIKGMKKIEKISRQEEDQITFYIEDVQFTFLYYPFQIAFPENLDGVIKIPDLLTLAAMKAYTIGRRAKWKDYVDLYFIIKDFFTVTKIAKKAKEIFGGEFNERIFREALSYFQDINYQEEIKYLRGFEVDKKTVQKALITFSVTV